MDSLMVISSHISGTHFSRMWIGIYNDNALLMPEGATGGVLLKKLLLEISQNSQKNTCDRISLFFKKKIDSGTGVFL